MGEKQLCRHQSQWSQRRKRFLPQQRFTCSPWWRPWLFLCTPGGPHGSSIWWENECIPKDSMTLESSCWNRFLAGPVDSWKVESCWSRFAGRILWPHGKQPEWSSLFLKNCSQFHPMTQTHAGAVHEGLQPLGMSYVGEVNGGLSPRQGTSHWNRWRMWGGRSSRKSLTTTSIPVPLHCLGEGGREVVSEVESGKKGEVGRRCFHIWVYFSKSFSDLIGSKLTSFPWIYSVLPVMIAGEGSASVSQAKILLLHFLSPL